MFFLVKCLILNKIFVHFNDSKFIKRRFTFLLFCSHWLLYCRYSSYTNFSMSVVVISSAWVFENLCLNFFLYGVPREVLLLFVTFKWFQMTCYFQIIYKRNFQNLYFLFEMPFCVTIWWSFHTLCNKYF